MKIYTLKTCDSCRKAIKFLKEHDLKFTEIPIRETPPTLAELKTGLKQTGELKKLFNTSGQDYRALNMKEKLPTLSEQEALQLLHENGNLIKRPFLVSKSTTLIGFKADEWENELTTQK